MASVELWAGQPGPIIIGYEAVGQTFDKGDLVKFVAGLVTIAETDNANAIAREDASGTTSAPIEIELVNFNSLYVMSYGAAVTSAAADVGKSIAITYTIGAHVISAADSDDAGVAHIVAPLDPVGTVGGRCIVKFNPVIAGGNLFTA